MSHYQLTIVHLVTEQNQWERQSRVPPLRQLHRSGLTLQSGDLGDSGSLLWTLYSDHVTKLRFRSPQTLPWTLGFVCTWTFRLVPGVTAEGKTAELSLVGKLWEARR